VIARQISVSDTVQLMNDQHVEILMKTIRVPLFH